MWESLDESFPAWFGAWMVIAACVAYLGVAKGIVLAGVLIAIIYGAYKVGQSNP